MAAAGGYRRGLHSVVHCLAGSDLLDNRPAIMSTFGSL